MIEFQDLDFLCWNIRGVVNRADKRHTRELVKRYSPSIVIVFETHCLFSKVERFWHKLGYYVGGIVEAQGQAGGIWLLVKRSYCFTVNILDIHQQVVTMGIKKGAR